jgi:hypothetical protein
MERIRFFDYEVDRDLERVCRHIDYVTKERCAASCGIG